MPRPKKSPPPATPVVPTTALVASAHRYVGKAPRIYSPGGSWQKRCYDHYSQCGEARYAARYFGRAMSKVVLYLRDAKGAKVTTGPSASLLASLFGGADGQSGMLEMVGVHLVVGGECYLVGREVDGADIWEVVGPLEIEGTGQWRVRSVDTSVWEDLDDDAVVIRVWVPKPDARWEADSPFRSMLAVLEEIEWLSRYIQAQARSRLTGNGMLVLPDSMTFPPPPSQDGKEVATQNEAEAFMLMLGEAMMESLKGDGSASEEVPVVVTAPSEAIGDIKHLTFWSQLDEAAREMRRDAIQRFAMGMDLPPEMVLGMGSNEGTGGGNSNGVSHWGAWMIEEQAIKMHIEPMCDLLVNALQAYYFGPLAPDASQTLHADTSALRLRPDRSAEAIELWDRGELKTSVMLAEVGFEPSDAPDDDERRLWLLRKIATGSATPEQIQGALSMLGVDLPVADVPNEVVEVEEPAELPPPPSLDDHPSRPRTPEESSILVYETLVLRALERAGNRLRNANQIKTPGHAFEAHVHIAANGSSAKCMEDAWGMADIVLEGRPDIDSVTATLDSYCRMLLANREPHTRERLVKWCEEVGI